MSMILHEISLSPDHDTVELDTFSDLHVGDPLFNRDLFYERREWVLEQPNRYVILNGDLMNIATKRSISDVYEDVLTPAEQLRWCKQELYPLRDRILSITNGNHEDRIKRDTSIDVVGELAEHLGIRDRHFPNGVLLKLGFGRKRKNGKRAVYTIYHTHGRGGGALQGGKVLRMARMANVVLADIYISSHTHFKVVFKESIYVPDLYNNNVRLVEQTFLNSSANLHWGGYAQVQGYKPGAQGSPVTRLYAEPKRVEVTL